MDNLNNHIENIILNDLNRSASEEEKLILKNWLEEGVEHQKQYDEWVSIWNLSAETKREIPDAELSWANFKQKIQPEKKLFISSGWKKMLAAASVVLCLSFVGKFCYDCMANGNAVQIHSTADGSALLADGSSIKYLKNTEIEYPKAFDSKVREIKMSKGDAFFEIAKNPEKPFIIHTPEVDIKVLGTSFNTIVNADSVEIILKTGKVQANKGNEIVTLLPGGKVTFLLKENKIVQTLDESSNIWEFQSESVESVLQKIIGAKKINILYNEKDIADKKISGRFNPTDKEQLLNVVALSIGMTVNKSNDSTYTLMLKK